MKQVFPMDSRVTYDAEGRPSYDRAVSSKPLRSLIRKLFTTGVMPNPSDTCQVRAGGDGMTLIVSPGLAVLEGGLYLEDAARTLSVTAADPTFDRIDTVVLRWNENDSVRDCDLHVVAGVPAKNPVRPALTREGSIYEIGLADIFVTKAVATITNEKITDTRMESARCGIVSSVSEWDTTTIYQQIQGELAKFKSDEEVAFANWFDYMKDQLTEDAAGRLQTEVDDVRGQIHTNLLNPTLETTTASGVTITNNNDGTFTLNGTATGTSGGNVWFNLFGAGIRPSLDLFGVKVGHKYRFTCTPNGGSTTTYWSNVSVYKGSTLSESHNDIGNGQVIEIDADETNLQVGINIRVGTTFPTEGLTFKPMLTTDLSADYDSFVKYSGSEERLNEQVASLHDSSKGVITNLLNSTMGDSTVGEVTCTSNGDGTYTFNGTASASRNFFPLPIGQGYDMKSGVTYRLSGCPKGGSSTTYELIAEAELGTTYIKQYAHDYGNGVSFTVPKADIDAGYRLRITISIKSNVTNLTFKPMLTTDLDATYNDYVPYSGDGRLNENVAEIYKEVEEHTEEISQINADLSESWKLLGQTTSTTAITINYPDISEYKELILCLVGSDGRILASNIFDKSLFTLSGISYYESENALVIGICNNITNTSAIMRIFREVGFTNVSLRLYAKRTH